MNNKGRYFAKTLLASIILSLAGFMAVQADDDSRKTWVYPNGANDTANLQAALDSCRGEKEDGCEVRLAAGIFYTNTLVANNFHGKLRGAGQYDTTIRPVENERLNITGIDPMFAEDPTAENPWPFLITFAEGDIKLSDLSFFFPDGPLNSDPWFLCGGPFEGVLAGAVLATGRNPVDFKVSDVSVTGGAGPFFGANVFNGIYYEGVLLREGAPLPDCAGDPFADLVSLSGNYTAKKNTISNVLSGLPVAALQDAKVTIKDNFIDALFGLEVIDVLDSDVTIAANLMDVGAVGVSILQNTGGPPDGNSTIVIKHNDIYVNRDGTSAFGVGFDAIEYFDYAGAARSENRIEIKENRFDLGIDVFDGILIDGDEGALRIKENSFDGAALGTGITILATDACRIRKNSFANFEADFTNIFLDATTSNCDVKAPAGTVVDLGTDNTVKAD